MFDARQERTDVGVGDYTKHVGFEAFTVVAINPATKQEIATLLDMDPEVVKEPEYLKKGTIKVKSLGKNNEVVETEKEVDVLTLDFYLKGETTENVKRHSLRIYKQEENPSFKDPENPKYKFINNVGQTYWATSEEDIRRIANASPSRDLEEKTILQAKRFLYFLDKEKNPIKDDDTGRVVEKVIDRALRGEEELYTLLNAWVGDNLARKFKVWNYDVSMKELFAGKLSSLREGLESDYADSFVAMYHIETAQDGQKQYEKLYERKYLPKDFMKYIKGGLKFPNSYNESIWKYFKDNVESPKNPEYALKSFYVYEPVRQYDATQDVAASTSTKVEETPASKRSSRF